jgi:L-alanine-DL-glutamate epimerase-like enolase superfamily enzyme
VGPNLPPPPRVEASIETEIAPLIVGESPFDVEKIVAKYLNGFPAKWTLETTTMAMAGVEIACWDIIGKSLDTPLHKILGGKYRQQVETFATMRYHQPVGMDVIASDADGVVKQGYRAIMIKEWDPDRTVEVVKTIRETVGDKIQLRVDPNQAWSVATAKRVCKRLEKYDLQCIEQPIFRWDMDGLAHLRQSVGIPIMLDEGATTIYRVLEAVKKDAVDFIGFDLVRVGGISAFKKACAIAEAAGIQVIMHWMGDGGIGTAAALQVAAGIPNMNMAHHVGLDSSLLKQSFDYTLPMVDIPDGPGIGVEVDEEQLARYSLKGRNHEFPEHYKKV